MSDYIKKILWSLPRAWEAKITMIQEAKDLNVLPLEELLRSLMIHELTMRQHSEEETKKEKIIALKSTSQEEEESDKLKMMIRMKNWYLSLKNLKDLWRKEDKKLEEDH